MIGNVNVPGALAADIANKVDKIAGKGLSTNDFTNEYKSQLDNMGDADDIAILKDFVFPKVSIPTDVNTTYTLTKGTRTITGTATSTTTEVSVPELGTWTCEFVNADISVSNTVTVLAPMTSATVEVPDIYGVQWDGTSTSQWTRIGASASFTDPVPYMYQISNYGSPFDNISPWKDMVKSERTGGTMVAIPKFWYKLMQSGSGMKILITNTARTGFSTSPAHMDRGDGKGERDVIYVGRYHCSDPSWKSMTSKKPMVYGTRSKHRTKIHELGSNIWMCDYATRFTIWLLYLVEFADWNSQAKIGGGGASSHTYAGSVVYNMGNSDSMPYHTGTTNSSRNSAGVTQYRYIEGLWDNCYDWIDGCYYNSDGLNIILNPADFSDSTGGTLIGRPTSGLPSQFTVSTPEGLFTSFYPTTSRDSSTTYSCDYWSFEYYNPCLLVGGSFNSSGNSIGLFCVGSNNTETSSGSIGSRIMELP